jgi:hypothetical protein
MGPDGTLVLRVGIQRWRSLFRRKSCIDFLFVDAADNRQQIKGDQFSGKFRGRGGRLVTQNVRRRNLGFLKPH